VTAVYLWNLALVAAAIMLSNDVLMYNSWVLYSLQAIVLIPVALRHARYAAYLFMPSLFTLAYFSVNLCFGGYLVPRGYGFYKEYTNHALAIRSYNQIVPYLLLCNVILFAVTITTLRELQRRRERGELQTDDLRVPKGAGLIPQMALLVGFGACSYFDFTGAFSVQLALLVVHMGLVSRRQAGYRFGLYALYLLIEVGWNFNNKREIVIVLFLLLFFEAYYRRTRLTLSVPNLLRYSAAACGFMGLVLTASILRGYGGFQPASLLQAARAIPEYAAAPVFQDAVIDNLELNYNYGSSITAIDFTIRGTLPHLLGLSFWKVLFLPVPRDLIGWKPESVMQLYTKAYDATFWLENGSLPVVFSSEMFVNFGQFGLLPFALVWIGLNKIFVGFHRASPHSFWYHTSAFLCLSILIFARGSGMELYLLTYMLAIPVFVVVALLRPWRLPGADIVTPAVGATR
jgi:hypothetical protein